MEVADIVSLLVECVQIILPFSVIWYIGEVILSTILGAAFGGKLSFKVY